MAYVNEHNLLNWLLETLQRHLQCLFSPVIRPLVLLRANVLSGLPIFFVINSDKRDKYSASSFSSYEAILVLICPDSHVACT